MTVSAQIIEVIDSLCSKLGIAIDWTSENVWPYIESLMGKYIKFEITTSAAWAILFIILPVVCFFGVKYFHPKAKEVYYDVDEGVSWAAVALWVLLISFLIAGVCVVATQIFDIITCLTFPEKQIFDYIMKLTTKQG